MQTNLRPQNFERPPSRHESDSAAHRRPRNLHPLILLESLAMLLKGQLGVALQLARQPLGEHVPFHGGRAGNGTRFHPARLSAPLEPTLYGGQGDPEDPRHLLAVHTAVHGVQHLQPEILRVRFHAEKFPRGSTYTQPAVSKVPEDVWRWPAGQPMSAQVWTFPRRILVLRALLRQILYQHLAPGLGIHG
jgi:hypothetical protein